jgi:capsular polysaccharide biosynthesis protein
MWMAFKFMDDQFVANYRDKDNLIDVSMDLKDPKMAVDVVNWMLTEVTDRMSSEARRVAETNRNYLESIIDKTADPLVKVNLYNVIAQQIQSAMSAAAKEGFAFKVIDPPKEPYKKSSPRRTLISALALIASLLIACFIAFLRGYVKTNEQARLMLQEEKSNLKGLFGRGGKKRKIDSIAHETKREGS